MNQSPMNLAELRRLIQRLTEDVILAESSKLTAQEKVSQQSENCSCDQVREGKNKRWAYDGEQRRTKTTLCLRRQQTCSA
jgi:hypothetical protein